MIKESTDSKPSSWKLEEIAAWQLDGTNSIVTLPPMQRGFVWKVNQIEALWDSLLRGFPVGSFLLSTSEDGQLFLIDGQQRATAIALGYYDPWKQENTEVIDEKRFWSLKKTVPTVWLDLSPKDRTNTQKFVIRVVTQSHPWGYQRVYNENRLSTSDRRNALKIFQKNNRNDARGYTQFSITQVFPYDSNLPVPLAFIYNAVQKGKKNWRDYLIELCSEKLPFQIETKYSVEDQFQYFEKLKEIDFNSESLQTIYTSFENLRNIEIPYIVVEKKILMEDEGESQEDPTLFVRLNSSGTRISGEELIYSIYKASFPETKELVENIGMSFLPPSQVISLVSRIALAEIDSGKYPPPISVKDFQKKIKDPTFKNKLKELIGDENNSQSRSLFLQAINVLRSENEIALPPVLIKKIIKDSPDLILMLLYRIHLFGNQSLSSTEQKRILATMTALSWFGVNNFKYVRELWGFIREVDFWNKKVLGVPILKDSNLTMYPLLNPDNLRVYLIDELINKNIDWHNLYPELDSNVSITYKRIIDKASLSQENDLINKVNEIWTYFTDNLFGCKSLILFAQRGYINKHFVDFNQMDSLEDTNTPWDWDHIYPSSWVYYKQEVPSITRLWNNCIGNFRALALEDNRSENDSLSPRKRLEEDIVKEQSFILENDWKFWNQLEYRIYEKNEEMIKIHASAVIHRMVNIYAEWYNSLNVGELYGY